MLDTNFRSWFWESLELESPNMVVIVRQPYWSLEEAMNLVSFSNDRHFFVVCIIICAMHFYLNLIEFMEDGFLNLLLDLLPLLWTFVHGF